MKAKRNLIIPWILAGILLIFHISTAEANELWFVDTRSGQANIERLNKEENRWMPSDMNEFLVTSNVEIPTIMIIHGNLMSRSESRQYGIKFYQMSRNLGRFRLVVWSWPSSKQHCRIRPDAQAKAIRADNQAVFLADFLKKAYLTQPDGKVSLLGFSYGAKVACRSLDLLARDPEFSSSENVPRIRTVLLAAAMDCGSLLPGRCYGNALSVTEEMLVHVNPEDETLRYYPLLWKMHGPRAVGKEGVSLAGISEENRRKIKSVTVHRIIGESHGFMASFRGLLACPNDFRHYVLFE